MTTQKDYDFLQSELVQLDRLIGALPEESVSRRSLVRRRRQVEEDLEAYEPPARWPSQIHLRFAGEPVTDHGIDARFGAMTLANVTDLVTKMAAARERPLRPFGPVPNRKKHRLALTGISHGSFGFHIEEVTDSQIEQTSEPSPIRLAFEELMSVVGAVKDEAAVVHLDPRVAGSIADFIRLLHSHDAECTLTFDQDSVLLRGPIQADLIAEPRDVSVREEVVVNLRGRFIGCLPRQRQVEFHDEGTDEILVGKVDMHWPEIDEINRDLLGRRISVTVAQTKVRGRTTNTVFQGYTDNQ